jgi:hypothetical protein
MRVRVFTAKDDQGRGQSVIALAISFDMSKLFAAVLLSTALCALQPVQAQYVQQGPKLVGNGLVGSPAQGSSVALSADGNTAIVGGPTDNSHIGAVWVFTRSGGVWSQQGPKIVGDGATGGAQQGSAVALSADGNTAIVGGVFDSASAGAAWIFIRDSGVWVQQGAKLVGAGTVGTPIQQGFSVALSGDGNTAIVGGNLDSAQTGAAWVFTRSGGVWSPQGPKLVGTGVVGTSQQGTSVALSADGNTAVIGGAGDSSFTGAVWVFTRSGNTWSQQAKLVGMGAVGQSQLGNSVALSADGNTAVVGGASDSSGVGAVWVFTRSGSTWSQQGPKLVGTGAVGQAQEGHSVAVSADGNTFITGGPGDHSFAGAAWIFTRSGGVWSQRGAKMVGSGAGGTSQEQGSGVALSGDRRTALVGGDTDVSAVGATWVFALVGPHDLNADGMSDVVWRNAEGDVAVWLVNGTQITPGPAYGPIPNIWSIVGQRDFDGDGNADLLWRDTNGNTAMWFMNGATVSSSAGVGNVPTTFSVIGVGDFNGDGKGDILWRDTSGNTSVWLMNGATVVATGGLGNVPTAFSVVATADFDGNGKSDVLWRDTSGNTVIWFMNGTTVASSVALGNIPTTFSVAGVGDFNGDGKGDILWRDTSGNTSVWLMNGATVLASGGFGNVPTTFSVAETGDFDGNGTSDLLWRDTSGNTAIWFINGLQVMSAVNLGNVPTNWTVQSANAE